MQVLETNTKPSVFPQPIILAAAFFVAIANFLAILRKRAARTECNASSPATVNSPIQTYGETQPDATAKSPPNPALLRPGPKVRATSEDEGNPLIAQNDANQDDMLPESPIASGRMGWKKIAETGLIEPGATTSKPKTTAKNAHSADRITRYFDPWEEVPREHHLKSAGVAAWLSTGSVGRARLGPLPRRRPYAPRGALKQPQGLASCVIKEDMPYPPANAEVTFEVRTTTVRHGRKLLRYAASSPLDTIYIKIPNTAPSSLHQPILESLSHTLELGQQRIVVGGGVRPGCTLMVLDLLCTPGEPLGEGLHELGMRARLEGGPVLQPTSETGCVEGTGGGMAATDDGNAMGRSDSSRPSWWEALNALLSDGTGGGGRVGRDNYNSSSNSRAGTRQHFSAVVGNGLSRWLECMGVEVPPGLRLLLQYRSCVLEAEFRDLEEGWAFRLLPQTEQALPTATPPGGSSATANGPIGVSLFVMHQVLVAPTNVGEGVKISVRTGGLSLLAAEVGGGVGSSANGNSSGRHFVVRGLGRHLPILCIPAPTTPGLDLMCPLGSEGEVITSMDIEGGVSGGGVRGNGDGSALTAAVAAVAPIAAGEADGCEVVQEGAYGRDGNAYTAVPKAVNKGMNEHCADKVAFAAPSSRQTSHRLPCPPAPCKNSDRGFSAVRNAQKSAHWLPVAPSPRTAAAAAVAATRKDMEPVWQYELNVAGLEAGRSGGGGSGGGGATAGPLLLHLELWQDNNRLLASKPLLLLPPSLAELASELQRLVRLQQELQKEEEEEEMEAARKVAEAKVAAFDTAIGVATEAATLSAAPQEVAGTESCSITYLATAQPATLPAATATTNVASTAAASPSIIGYSGTSADQLVSDMGMWLEFVHDALLALLVHGAAVSEDPVIPPSAGGVSAVEQSQSWRACTEGPLDTDRNVILSSSLDLRAEVLRQRRRHPGFVAAMLRTGLGLLEALVSYGSGPLVEHMLADFRSLGYGAAEVWAATGTAAGGGGGGGGSDGGAGGDSHEGQSLLQLAAASGDLTTLRAVLDLAEAASACSSGGGDGGGSPWLLHDGNGFTPPHLLAAVAGDGCASAAASLEWALNSGMGGSAVHKAWVEALDCHGFTPAQIFAAEAAAAEASSAADPSPFASLSPSFVKLLPEPLQEQVTSALVPASTAVAAAPFVWTARGRGGDAHGSHRSARGDAYQPSGGLTAPATNDKFANIASEQVLLPAGNAVAVAAQVQVHELVAQGLQVPAAAAATAAATAAVERWKLRHRSRGSATAALLSASLFGFDASSGSRRTFSHCLSCSEPLGAEGVTPGGGIKRSMESQYQAYVSRRSLTLAQAWVVLHLILLVSAVRRLVADTRLHELAAPLLYSSGHIMMLVVLRAAPGFRLYLPYRGAWWSLAATLRTSSKLLQLGGWVALPDSTLRYVQGGATLVADCVLPALFEPCPLPSAIIILVYDFFVTAALYLRIGYAADLASALLKAAVKCALGLSLRLAMDLRQRSAFLAAVVTHHGDEGSPTRDSEGRKVLPAEAEPAAAVEGPGPSAARTACQALGKGKID